MSIIFTLMQGYGFVFMNPFCLMIWGMMRMEVIKNASVNVMMKPYVVSEKVDDAINVLFTPQIMLWGFLAGDSAEKRKEKS